MSGYADLKTLLNAINVAGVVRFISKPWHEIELYLAIDNALGERELVRENARLAAELRGLRALVGRQQAEVKRLEEISLEISRVAE
jgi:DNA-binding NtrC family response regulator